jgi:hypothetical protein
MSLITPHPDGPGKLLTTILALALVALVEAIILMTAIMVFGVSAIQAIGRLGDTATDPGPTITQEDCAGELPCE